MIQRLWQPLECDDAQVQTLVHELGIAPVTARLLFLKGKLRSPDVPATWS